MHTRNHAAHHDLTKHVFLWEYSTEVSPRKAGENKELDE